MKIGLDIGSTTIKCVVLNDNDEILHKSYERHYSQITEKIRDILQYVRDNVVKGKIARLAISGSAGMGVAENCRLPFVQEVFATRVAANRLLPGSDVIIELGGEDAKILFLTGGMEVRMNGTCAGGTGAFIDQMATLLNVAPDEMNELAKAYEKTYTIASRCGVFAKSDIQPLLNQGARKNDIAASIFYAVVNQTIAGLAQGREIKGNIVYLGGPLTFLSELRKSFDETLKPRAPARKIPCTMWRWERLSALRRTLTWIRRSARRSITGPQETLRIIRRCFSPGRTMTPFWNATANAPWSGAILTLTRGRFISAWMRALPR